jgi:hypothetical protein
MAGHLLQKCLSRCAKASSFYTAMSGFILPTLPVQYYGCEVMYQPPYHYSLMPRDFHLCPRKQHLGGKLFSTDADIRQAITLCRRHFTPSSALGCKHRGSKGTNTEMSVVIVWSSEVYLLLLTCHPIQIKILGIRVFATNVQLSVCMP